MIGPPPIRVLVVDDSAFARKVVRELLGRADGIEVVGVARDGLEALEKVAELAPDVITLDLTMPTLDGLAVLRSMRALPRPPRTVIVSVSDGDSELAVEALQAGAVALVHKPTALAVERLYDLGDELVARVREAFAARPLDPLAPAPRLAHRAQHARPARPAHDANDANDANDASDARHAKGRGRILVVGTSTGGPQALTRFLRTAPADLAVPMVIALHIPPGYTAALAQRLDSICAVDVIEARSGLALSPGVVAIAPGGSHVEVVAADVDGAGGGPMPLVTRILPAGAHEAHAPSVDILFTSAARAAGAGAVGVVLTGMGNDGEQGAAAIKRAGGAVVAESAASCVVYGMPRCVIEAGYADDVAVIDEVLAAALRRL